MGTQGIGTFGINSKFASGSLVFYEKAVGRTATGDVFTIGTAAVKVGGTAQDVDFQWYGIGSISAIFDCGDSSFTMVGVNMATNAPIVSTGTTASSSTATGEIITAGGLGVAKDSYFGGRLDVTATAVHATTGRVGKFTATVVAPNQGDGYGVFEVDVTASGTFAGTTNAFSSWLNVAAAAVPGGNLICVQNNGIYLPSGITASSAKMIMGMRMQYVADDGANPGSLYCFSTNIYSNVLTAIFDVNAIVDLGGSTGAQTGNDYKIPLFKDASAGVTWYVNVYHS